MTWKFASLFIELELIRIAILDSTYYNSSWATKIDFIEALETRPHMRSNTTDPHFN